jgi:hypothetical protein
MSSLLVERLIQFALVVTALTQLPPVLGVLGGEALLKGYGIRIDDPGLLMLMRHRALMFAIVGVPLLIAVVAPSWRVPAMTAALFSVLGFIALAATTEPLSPQLTRVARIDWAVLAVLVPAFVLALLQRPGTTAS